MLLPAYVLAASNTLDVKCVDKSGAVVAGAKVEIQKIDFQNPDQKWKDKKSDNNGLARFDKMDDGVYRVLSRKPGFAPALYEYVVLKGDKQENINLLFEPGADHPLYFEPPKAQAQGEEGKPAPAVQSMVSQAIETMKAGLADLQGQKFADAENKFKAALALFPSSADARYYLGVTYGQQNKWDLAEPELKKAFDITGALMQVKPVQGQQNPYGQLHQNVEGLLQKIPGFRLLAQGSENLKNKNYKEAIAAFQESVKYIPDNADAYYNMALAQANSKMFDEAQQNIQKAIAMKPTEKAYTDLKQQIEDLKARDVVEKAQLIVNEGEDLFKKNDYAGALQKYQQAKAMLPPKGQAIALTLVGKAEAALNHQDQALAAYKQAMELDPGNDRFKLALAQYYVSQKKYDEALAVYSGGGAGTGSDQALFKLGQSLSKDDANRQVAELAFEKAIQANPANAEAYYELGMMLYFSKENDKHAKELLTKYMEIGKDQGHMDNAKGSLVILDRRLKQ